MYEDSVLVIHILIFNVFAKLNQKDLLLRSWLIAFPCICYCSVILVLPPTFHYAKVIENVCWVFFLSAFVLQLCFFSYFSGNWSAFKFTAFLK